MDVWQPIDCAPQEGFIVGGFFTECGHSYARPMMLDVRRREWPPRTEFYDGKQRVFPTHHLPCVHELPLPTPPETKP